MALKAWQVTTRHVDMMLNLDIVSRKIPVTKHVHSAHSSLLAGASWVVRIEVGAMRRKIFDFAIYLNECV